MVQDGSGFRDMMYVRELGAHPPDSYAGPSETLVTQAPVNEDFVKRMKIPIFAPTGNLGENESPEKGDETLPNLEELEIRCPTENLPVWLYGNYWAESEPKHDGDRSHLRLVGIGARFGSSFEPFNVFNSKPEEISLRGSSISICTSDGE
jgi:hypothetical protein